VSQTSVTLRRVVSILGPLTLGALCLAILPATQASAQTTIAGTVYAPNGTDPLPNILVYVASTPVQPFAAGPGTSCGSQNAVVSGNPIAEAVTDYKGMFAIQSPALTALGSATVNVVIQAGKWRQQYPSTAIVGGAVNGPLTLTMPGAAATGADLPQIAVVTGSADAVECVLLSMGIKQSEFTDLGGSGHINLFAGTQSSGATITGSTATEASLMSNQTPLSNYDLLMLGCQGSSSDATANTATDQQNLTSYTNSGGRVFATHYEYIWLNKANTFANAANWRPDESSLEPENGSTGTITVDTTYPEGIVLANWLQYIGASPAGAAGYGEIPNVPNIRQDQTGIIAPTQSWGTLNPPYIGTFSGTPVMQFSFDTPLGTSTVPIVLLTFTNTPTNFTIGDPADTVTINVTDQANSGTSQPGLNVVLTAPPQLVVTGLSGGVGSGWACNLANLTCTETASLMPGANDPITMTVSVPLNATLGPATLSAALSGGGISNANQCGRVLFNEYHVEPPRAGSTGTFPSECPVTLEETGAEKFLEFSLYNLSNFIAPVTTDTINIQSPSQTTITNLVTPIYYGQTIGDTNGANAIVNTTAPGGPDNGNLLVYVDTTLACTLLNSGTGGMCPDLLFEGYNAGPHIIYAKYTGDTDYAPSQSPNYPVVVQPDNTATVVATSLTPAILGNPVTFTATVTAPYATPVGAVSFFADGVPLGTGTVNAAGVATYTTSILTVGTHAITATYAASLNSSGTLNFNPSASVAIPQVVTYPPATTTTTLVSSVNPSYLGQNVTFTAMVTATSPLPAAIAGAVTFFDGAVSLGTVAITTTGAAATFGIASFSTTALTVGTHSITAVFTPATPFPTTLTSTSTALSQVVNPNVFTMVVDPTNLNLTIGSGASITITITDVGAFNEPVTLGCTGVNTETACLFAQLVVPAGGGVTRLTVTPNAPHPCTTTATAGPGNSRLGYLGLTLAAFALFLARKRRNLVRGLSLAAALCLLPLLNGCGTSGCTDFGDKPGAYTFTVTATSAAPNTETLTQTITMTVKP
jgi:hypothetical protein